MRKRCVSLLLSLFLLCSPGTLAAADDEGPPDGDAVYETTEGPTEAEAGDDPEALPEEEPAEESEDPPAEEPGGPTEPDEPLPDIFPDVTEGNWFYPYIAALVSQGVIDGFPDGLFRPQDGLSTGQALKLILLAAGYVEQEPEEEDAHWAQGYLDYAVKKGFVGQDAVTDLNAPISRYEIAAIAANALSLAPSGQAAGAFADTADSHVLALHEAGIVEGSFDGGGARRYYGDDGVTRGEISAVIHRMAGYVAENLILYAGYRIPVDHNLTRHGHDTSLLAWEDGRISYEGDIDTLTGIDVSYYQKDIDWQAVAADGIDFAFIRVGYRGYGAGSLNEDECFRANLAGAIAAGISVGVYFFSQAITPEEAREEARYTLSLIQDYDITWPVVFDWESIKNVGARTDGLDNKILTDCALAFCETVAAAGYTPMVYFNKSFGYLRYDLHAVQQYDVWHAHHTESPDYLYDYQIWQYTSSGSVRGIDGRVDMNIAFKNFGR